jgi:hypothetical protein
MIRVVELRRWRLSRRGTGMEPLELDPPNKESFEVVSDSPT